MNSEEKRSALDEFFASLDPKSEGREDLATDATNRTLVGEGERSCPICQDKMATDKKQGILIDVCQEHGVWLDKGELASVIRRSNQIAVKEAMRTAGESGVDSGFLLGYALGSSV